MTISTQIDVVFEDDALIIVNKPSGLLVHPTWLSKNERSFVVEQVKEYLNTHKVYNVHRLDRPTCGLILLCKDALSARVMSEQFKLNQVKKRYVAVCRGFINDGVIDYPLKEELDKIADPFARDKPAQTAQTGYKLLAKSELDLPLGRYSSARFSLVSIAPKTGRKHQIRRHFKHVFHPLVGDTRHGDGRVNQFVRQHYAWNRLALRATELDFLHPHQKTQLTVTAPRSKLWRHFLSQLNFTGEYAGL